MKLRKLISNLLKFKKTKNHSQKGIKCEVKLTMPPCRPNPHKGKVERLFDTGHGPEPVSNGRQAGRKTDSP